MHKKAVLLAGTVYIVFIGWMLHYGGNAFQFVIEILVGLLLATMIVGSFIGLGWLLNHVTKPHVTSIDGGVIIHHLGVVTVHHSNVPDTNVVETKVVDAPATSFQDLLRFAADGQLVLGLDEQKQPILSEWDKIKTLLVVGMSQVGKSNTLFFLTVQLVMMRYDVTICDSHGTKERGLISLMKPLHQYCLLARSDEAIEQAVQDFYDELQDRKAGVSTSKEKKVLVIDEWTSQSEKKILPLVQTILNEGSGYEMYLVVAGQLLTHKKVGGTGVRRSFQSMFVHRMDSDEAHFILKNRTLSDKAAKFSVGETWMRSSNSNDMFKVFVPFGTREDAKYALSVIQGS